MPLGSLYGPQRHILRAIWPPYRPKRAQYEATKPSISGYKGLLTGHKGPLHVFKSPFSGHKAPSHASRATDQTIRLPDRPYRAPCQTIKTYWDTKVPILGYEGTLTQQGPTRAVLLTNHKAPPLSGHKNAYRVTEVPCHSMRAPCWPSSSRNQVKAILRSKGVS